MLCLCTFDVTSFVTCTRFSIQEHRFFKNNSTNPSELVFYFAPEIKIFALNTKGVP